MAGDVEDSLAERQHHRVVLGNLEAQNPERLLFFDWSGVIRVLNRGRGFDHVDRSGVAVRDLAGLRQNEFQQPAGVALGRERGANPIQLLELTGENAQLAAGSAHGDCSGGRTPRAGYRFDAAVAQLIVR